MSKRVTRGRAARSNSAVLDQDSDMHHQVSQPVAAPVPRKRTRKAPVIAPVPEDEVAAPVVTTTVASSTATATVTDAFRTVTTTRKTRSLRSAVDNSPLRSLDTVPKSSSKRKRITQKQSTQEQDFELKREQEVLDPDQGLFFQRKPPIYLHPESPLITGKAVKKIKVEVSENEKLLEKDLMTADALNTDSLLDIMVLRTELERAKQEFSSLQNDNARLQSGKRNLRAENGALAIERDNIVIERDSFKSDYNTLMTDHDKLRTSFISLDTNHNRLKTEHQTAKDDLLQTQKELRNANRMTDNISKELNGLREATAPKPEPKPKKVEPSPEALAILHNIERQRDAHLATRSQVASIDQNQNQNNDQQEQTDATTENASANADHEMDDVEEPEQTSSVLPVQDSPATPTSERQTPARAPATQDATPQTRGWGFKSLISRFVPASFTSPAPAPAIAVAPATAPPAVLQPVQAQNLADILQPTPPTPTPATERRRRPHGPTSSTVRAQHQAQRMTQQRKSPSDARAVVTIVANSVRHEDTHKAIDWAKEAVQKLKLADPSTIGEKRKRIEAGVKMGDLKSFPARAPWQSSGTFSFHDELFDLDDDDLAPAWCVLQEMLDDVGIGGDSPPAKKRKTAKEDTTMDEDITPLNETELPAFNKSTSRPYINTHGNSASLSDLQPRSSRVPSPMFSDPSDRNRDANVFTQQQQAPSKTADEQKLDEEYMRKLRIKMRKEGEVWSTPGGAAQNEAYRMALLDQEEKDRKEAEEEAKKKAEEEAIKRATAKAKEVPAEDAPLWTQQPPPAPTPAHASLPTPLTTSPSVPPVQAEEPVLAPVSPPMDPVERQRAKLMKHTPARPSRLREATVPSPSVRSDFGASPVQIIGESWDFEIPDPEPLDLGDPELLLAAEALAASDAYKAHNVGAYGGADVPMIYEEEESDDEL
jgi:hypothetical protein